MLDSIRGASNTWVAKLLLGLLVVSFAAWGISGSVLNGVGNDAVITAGDTSVTPVEYRLAYDRQLSTLSQRFGTRLTSEQAEALGLQNQVLSQLVAGAVLDEQARQMGLGVSREKLADLTASDPAFHDAGGSFDRQRFDYVMRQVGMKPEEYLTSRRQVAVRQQIVDTVSGGLKAPDTLLHAVALYRGEDRTAEYVALPLSLAQPVEDPSDDVLKAWFEKHKKQYAAPEYRQISYLTIDPAAIADPSTISDEQVKKYYEDNKTSFTTPEKRSIEQLVFADKDAAGTAAESLRSGSTFEDLVEAQGKTLDDVGLGTFAKADIADDAVADAAFGLDKDQVSGVVDGQFGPVLLRVTDIEPAKTKPVAEVEDQIRKELALDEANRILLDVNDRYEDARAGGATLKEAADKLNLEMKTIKAVDRTGRDPEGTELTDIPESEALLEQAFETEEGIENPAITTKDNGFLYYEVSGVQPAHDRELAEVHDKVVADWKQEQAVERLSKMAEDYEKQLKDGKTLDDIAADAGQEKQVKRGLKRQGDDADIGTAGVQAIFSMPKGSTGIFTGPDGQTKYVFKITEVFEPAAAGPEAVPDQVKEEIATGISGDLLQQMVVQLQARYDVRVNQNALSQAMSY